MEDEEFTKSFEGFGDKPAPVTPPTDDPVTPPVTPPVEPPKEDPKPAEEPKKDEQPSAKLPEKDEVTPPADDAKKEEDAPKPAPAPDTPPAPETPEPPQPLTKEDVTSIISDMRNEERTSGKEIETTTTDVLEAYYPEGLSNTLVDEKSGKELKVPQDVVDASGGQMSTEEATQWLMNEQYKLDQAVSKIKDDARSIAETTLNFKRDATTVLKKYDPLFKQYPALQEKVWNKLMKQVKADDKKGVILSSPDVMEHYDDYLEPYQLAFEHSEGKSATNATPPEPPPAKPTAEDRMDEGGDGGASPVNDPTDFAQQVNKELAKEL